MRSRWNVVLDLHRKHVLFFIGFCLHFASVCYSESAADTLDMARQLFYSSVENEKALEKAFNLFQKIGEQESYEGMALTYIGALTALKGKYAFSPISKYRWVLKGLQVMDQAIMMNPENIEARFIRGMTCFYLPFFFRRKKTAYGDFQFIVSKIKEEFYHYDGQMMLNVIQFLLDHAKLDEEEIQTLQEIQYLIGDNEE